MTTSFMRYREKEKGSPGITTLSFITISFEKPKYFPYAGLPSCWSRTGGRIVIVLKKLDSSGRETGVDGLFPQQKQNRDGLLAASTGRFPNAAQR
ncbi:hypothetical protein [Chitinophaga rhizosphaerae]|uniref:hypothetical protein n=1 Tax=Chitinophaga rhizosphaerae TaxID=1864947 RepID=UPI000F800FF4|nr:hypothetical protein [Chitinophaga rhizosphaerae]